MNKRKWESYIKGIESQGQGSCGGCNPMNGLGAEMWKVKKTVDNKSVLSYFCSNATALLHKK